MSKIDERAAYSLFLLRLGLGIFLGLTAVAKIVTPQVTSELLRKCCEITLGPSWLMLLGAVELVVSLLLVLGMYKTFSYGAALFIHAVYTFAHMHVLLDPFGDNQIYLGYLPLLLAFISLFTARQLDTKFSLSKKKGLFS